MSDLTPSEVLARLTSVMEDLQECAYTLDGPGEHNAISRPLFDAHDLVEQAHAALADMLGDDLDS